MAHRSPLGVVALATAALLAVATLHAFVVDHRVCVEHGEFEHAGHGHDDGHAHRHTHDGDAGSAVRALGPDGTTHDHCRLLFIRGTTPTLAAEEAVTNVGVTGFEDAGERTSSVARLAPARAGRARGPPPTS